MGTEKCRWAVVKTTPANCPKSLGVYVGLQQCTPLTNVNSASPTHCLHTIPVWPLPTNPNDDEWYQSDAIEASSQYGRTHTHTHNGGEECAGDFTISTGDGICHSLAVYHNDGDRPMQDDQVDTLSRGEPSPEHLSAPWRRCSWGDWGPGPAAGWRPPAPAPAASAPAASPPAGRAIIPRDQSLIRTKCLQGRLKKKSGSCSNLPIGRSAEGTSHRPPPGPSCGRGPPRRGWPPTPSQGSQMSAPPPCCSPRRPPAAGRTPPPRALSAPEMLDDPRSARCLGNVTPPTVASVSLGCLLSNVRRCLSSVTQNTSRVLPSLDPPPPKTGRRTLRMSASFFLCSSILRRSASILAVVSSSAAWADVGDRQMQ